MYLILEGILSLVQHNQTLLADSEQYRPARCAQCGRSGLWCHGSYPRQSDYDNSGSESLNPVAIPRFYCPHCSATCSVLPECIPPKRHYLWLMQQIIFQLYLSGNSYQSISQQTKPSRWTISRWCRRLKDCYLIHADHLRSKLSVLLTIHGFQHFWQTLLEHLDLSSAMVSLNHAGVAIP